MTVAHIWYSDETYTAEVILKNNQIKKNYNYWEPLIRNASICSKSEFLPNQEKILIRLRKAIGDSSEVAILKFTETAIGSVKEYRKSFLNLFELPFNSTNKFSLTICQSKETGKKILLMKGICHFF